MPLNFPGPYEVRINYITNEPAPIAEHQLRLSCQMSLTGNPGDPFSAWTPFQKNGSAVTSLQGHVDALMPLVRALYLPTTTFTDAELWQYNPSSFDAVFRASYELGLVGTGAGTTQVAGQLVTSFRTQNGGIMKVDLRGTAIVPAATDVYPFANAAIQALAVYMAGATSPWWARDNSYAIIPLKAMPGTNEHSWKVAFRP